MTTQQAKKWLMRARDIDKEVDILIKEQAAAFDRATKTTSAAEGERVQTSACNGSESKFIKYSEYSVLIDKRIDELYDTKKEILRAVDKVENGTYRTLLTLRYIRFMTWEQIAEEMNMSCYWVRTKIHREALEELCWII